MDIVDRSPVETRLECLESDTEKDPEIISFHGTDIEDNNNDLIRLDSNVERFQRFSELRKALIVAVISFSTMQIPFATTSFLPAVPEIANDFNTSQELITGGNGIASIFMAISPLFFGPLTEIYGRRPLMFIGACLFCVSNIVVALAPNVTVFIVFRCINYFGGTAFFSMGASIVGDIYSPSTRGRAMGWVLFGSQIGPTLGPIVGGLIITFKSWRLLYWIQTAMSGSLLPLYIFLLPETSFSTLHARLCTERNKKFIFIPFNPLRILMLARYPNITLVAIISMSLLWNKYSLLTPIRDVLDPRFNLTSPIYGALFYFPAAVGYIVGTYIGGKWTDYYVRVWRAKRGERIPEDRIRSTIIPLAVLLPFATLLYGWSLQERKGGMALPIVGLFLYGLAQTMTFPAINAYCVESMPKYKSDAISGNYCARYISQAISTSVALPLINKIGVGGSCTLSAGILWLGAGCSYTVILYGKQFRDWRDSKEKKTENDRNEETQPAENAISRP
jgi:multidrug resistance protein